MLTILEIVIFCVLGFFLFYLLLLSVLALFVPIRRSFTTVRQRKFAFVVPAHNEERHIEKTIRSLQEVEYPRSMYDVVVIADNCTDSTGAIAQACGTIVLTRFDAERRGKGFALQWAFDQLLNSTAQYEGFIVIDADSVVAKNFLHVLNWYLEQGYGSIQAADLVAPNPGAWSSEVSRISLLLYNLVRPLGRKAFNGSAGLRGNGMCFSASTLRKVPWRIHSLTEDLEYGLVLLLNGIMTVFAPETYLHATMPLQSKHAESQRIRWEGGRLPVVKKYAPILFYSAIKEFSWIKADALIELLTPAFVNMVGTVMMITGVKYFSVNFLDVHSGMLIQYWYGLLVVPVLYVCIGLIAARADRALCKALFYFPIYLLWKIQLYIKLFFTGITKEWIRTTRE